MAAWCLTHHQKLDLCMQNTPTYYYNYYIISFAVWMIRYNYVPYRGKLWWWKNLVNLLQKYIVEENLVNSVHSLTNNYVAKLKHNL